MIKLTYHASSSIITYIISTSLPSIDCGNISHFAKESGCLGLITGESIGQVASQTIQALAVTNAVVNMPVFRPLIGMDKDDLINHIGTIAKSGTADFINNTKENASAVDLIGKFGVAAIFVSLTYT